MERGEISGIYYSWKRSSDSSEEVGLKHEFTAVFEHDGDWVIAYCPEIPGANGQGKTKEEARESLAEAIHLILEDRREEGLKGVPEDAERETVVLE
jgi:predicted RNase H-like HicB family nuclease